MDCVTLSTKVLEIYVALDEINTLQMEVCRELRDQEPESEIVAQLTADYARLIPQLVAWHRQLATVVGLEFYQAGDGL